MKLLNIGAGPAAIPIPPWYHDWDIVRLDTEEANKPDLLMDAMELDTLDAGQFDAAYASHLLEHFYPMQLERFLGGMRHVLKEDGYVELRVPDVMRACEAAVKAGTLDAFCYQVGRIRVTAWDMMYGYLPYQQLFGEPMAHHNAFTTQTLSDTLNHYGFPMVYIQAANWEIGAIACLTDLNAEMKRRMGIDKRVEHRTLHPDDGIADVGPVRLIRPVAVIPLCNTPGNLSHSDQATTPAAGGRGTHLPRGSGLGRRL